jgi:ABC-2 type transport system permease protein
MPLDGPATVVTRVTARRAVRSGAVWGGVFGLYVLASAAGYASTYPTPAARTKLARSLGGNSGLAALLGPARRLDSVAGFTSWRTMGVLTVVGAIWAMLLATRLLRGEEEEGRWELLLSGQTTRRGAAAQAMAGLGAGLATLWAETALVTVAVGWSAKVHFATGASLFLATALMAGAALFLAVGALTAELAATRRQANAIAAGVLGLSFLIRMVADASSDLAWLRWASPLGWAEQLRPLTGSRPLALVPIAILMAALLVAASVLAGSRDLGDSALPSRDTPPPHTGLLGSAAGLAVRLGRPVAIGWIAGLAALGLVLGLVAQTAASAISGSASIEKAIRRLGGYRLGAASYLGVALVIAAALVAFAAAGQVAAARTEEAEGHLDHLLARPVSRTRWLADRLALGVAFLVALGVVTGLASWAGAASQHSGLALVDLLQAGINIVPPALFVLGAGAMAYGLWPRAAPGFTYGLVAWSFLVELIASLVTTNRLLLDSSVLSHIAPAPAANPDWTAAGWLSGLGLVAAVVGIIGFDRRDLAGA